MKLLLTQSQLKERIENLRQSDALEISFDALDEEGRLYIPYMMNDTIEDYLVLTDPYVHMDEAGEILEVTASVCEEYRTCYQYHLIGHFWREGEEEWRRLVNIIGNIRDKAAFIGESCCNRVERSLIDLMGFAPFRFFSPVDWSLDEIYPDTKEGMDCAASLAVEAGDSSLLRMILEYHRNPSPFFVRRLAQEMASGRHQDLYHLIDRRITEASREYAIRNYGEQKNSRISNLRFGISEMMRQDGYSGLYPHFFKEGTEVTVYEEHPFTILEEDDFDFDLHIMELKQTEQGIRRHIATLANWQKGSRS